jgi:hypothetical protein
MSCSSRCRPTAAAMLKRLWTVYTLRIRSRSSPSLGPVSSSTPSSRYVSLYAVFGYAQSGAERQSVLQVRRLAATRSSSHPRDLKRIPADWIKFVIDACQGKVFSFAVHLSSCRGMQLSSSSKAQATFPARIDELHKFVPSQCSAVDKVGGRSSHGQHAGESTEVAVRRLMAHQAFLRGSGSGKRNHAWCPAVRRSSA